MVSVSFIKSIISLVGIIVLFGNTVGIGEIGSHFRISGWKYPIKPTNSTKIPKDG
jgi:hypothetical protein